MADFGGLVSYDKLVSVMDDSAITNVKKRHQNIYYIFIELISLPWVLYALLIALVSINPLSLKTRTTLLPYFSHFLRK